MTKEELQKYEPKGKLEGFPKEIIARILECQEEQGNKKDISVFENLHYACAYNNGVSWNKTKEGYDFWGEVIMEKNFNLFFEKYPKQDNIVQDKSQDFKLGDKVYDIMCKSSGIITNVNIGAVNYPLTAELENGKIINTYTIDGILNSYFKTPQLLHYRDDYDYTTIDFKNLPKRQEPKRWRGEINEKYYCLSMYFKVYCFSEEYSNKDTELYNSGNYFKTKEEAQDAADKLKEYLKQLIKEI